MVTVSLVGDAGTCLGEGTERNEVTAAGKILPYLNPISLKLVECHIPDCKQKV